MPGIEAAFVMYRYRIVGQLAGLSEQSTVLLSATFFCFSFHVLLGVVLNTAKNFKLMYQLPNTAKNDKGLDLMTVI